MANKTIHQLSAMNEFDSGDEFAVYDTSANTTGKMTIANVLGTSITGLGTTATTIPGAISELNTGLGTVNTLLGSGDISSIGDGSVTGAISSLNNDLVNHSTIIGDTSISGIGGGTLTGAVSALNSKLDGIIIQKTYDKAYTIDAEVRLNILGNEIGYSTPSGYTLLGIISFSSGHGDVTISSINASAQNTNGLSLRNNAKTAISATARIVVAYIKSALL